MPLQIIRQDITKLRVDAIVNTTNREMVGYSGVDLAVHKIAGDKLDEECAKIMPLMKGQAKITDGYNLPCKYIIHTSGPVWYGGGRGERDILRSCYIESLKLAIENQCRSVAFPLISSGVYRYPKEMVLKVAIDAIAEFLLDNEIMVYLCVYDKEAYSFSQKLFDDIKSFIDDDYIDSHDEDYYLGAKYKFLSCESVRMPASPCADRRRTEDDIPFGEYFGNKDKDSDTKKTPSGSCNTAQGKSLKGYIREIEQEDDFRKMLFALIDKSGKTDVQVYKGANIDKRVFAKLKKPTHNPAKRTVIALSISLELDLDTTQELLACVGYTLSRHIVFDKIIRYFIHNKNYNIHEINQALFEFDQPLLGSF